MRFVLTRLVLPVLVSLVVIGSSAVYAQEGSSGFDEAYGNAVKLLETGLWIDAAQAFDSLARQYPDSPEWPLIAYNRAKALYHAGRYREAVRVWDDLLARFPESPQSPYASYFAANCRYQLRDLPAALKLYLSAYVRSENEQLTSLVVASLASFEATTVAGMIESGAAPSLSRDDRCRLATQIAYYLEKQGDAARSGGYRTWCDTSKVHTAANGKMPAAARILKVAVVLPLSGEMQAFGEDVFNGAVIGAEQARQNFDFSVNLVPFDTKGDPIVAARVTKGLIDQPYHAVIGPLTSDEAAVMSASLACSSVPLIIPAATESGLTELSPGSFQLSPNIQLQGATMAEYAVHTLMADSAAVIAPSTPEQTAMVQAFVDRFKQLGGTVVAVEIYRDRDKNFGALIHDLKSVLLGRVPDSAVFLNERGDTLEAEAIPAHIDCLFLPGSPDELRQLLTQLRFYNLNASYLGSDGWGDESVYNLGEDVTRGAVFPSPFIQASSGSINPVFAAAYVARYGKRPSRLACLGYDAVQILAQAGLTGTDRVKLVASLSKVSGYDGAAGRVTMGVHRENTELPLYRIATGRAVPVDLSSGKQGTGK